MALTFPSPIGGTSLSSDLAPCIVFAVIFALLYPFMIYRTVMKGSRSILSINNLLTIGERPVVFALRARQATNISSRLSNGMLKYMQLSFTLGYVSLASDLPKFLRVLIVNASRPEEFENVSGDLDRATDQSSKHLQEDHPRMRFWARRAGDFLGLAYLAAVVPGILSSLWLNGSIGNEDPTRGNQVMAMRYASAAVSLFLTVFMALWMLYAMHKLPRIKREAGWVFLTLCGLLCIPPLYRLGVMHSRTTGTALSQSVNDPGALNKPADKALFYIFHILPEFAFGLITFVRYNMRELFGTGFAGDVLWKDETPEQKEKREKKEAERKAKKAQKHEVAQAIV